MEQTLEKPMKRSPLLSDAVIERDYTKGIENQLSQGNTTTTQPETPSEPVNPAAEESKKQTFNTDFSEPESTGEQPKGFSFEQEVDDASDVTGEEEEGFNLASGSAKTFANVIGDLVKIKVPEFTFNYCKVDLGSIRIHINNGNMHPSLGEAFESINVATRESLEFSDDEIKMWKKAFKEYLEYKDIKAANPETAFYIATATLVVTQAIKTRELAKNNKQYITDAINSFNPAYFDSFKSKNNQAPEEPTGEAPTPQPEAENSKKSL